MNLCLYSSRINLSGILMFIILGTDVSWILYCIIIENEFLYNFFLLSTLLCIYSRGIWRNSREFRCFSFELNKRKRRYKTCASIKIERDSCIICIYSFAVAFKLFEIFLNVLNSVLYFSSILLKINNNFYIIYLCYFLYIYFWFEM